MEFNDKILKEEVTSFVSSLQKLLPRKKDLLVVDTEKYKVPRLADVHIEAKSVFPKCFIGAKLLVMREVMHKVKLVQQYSYGSTKDSYRCFSQVINKEMDMDRKEDGVHVDASGSATATYTEYLDNDCEMRLTSKIKDLVSSETELVIEREKKNSVGSFVLGMKDVDPKTLNVVGQWIQKVHPDLYVGAEFGVKPLSYPPKPHAAISTRYQRGSFALSTTLSKTGFQVCFFKQFAPDLRISTIVHEANDKFSQPAVGIALQKDYSNGSVFKVFVDSEKCGGFTVQKDISFYDPANETRVVKMVWSTLLDRQRRIRFGFGFHLDF